MIRRAKYDEISDLLDSFPAVAIIGPRQVGKTTLALEIAATRPSVYLDLQRQSDRVKLDDPAYFLRQNSDKLIILDEIHRVPEVFSEIRGVIDENRRKSIRSGQFLILGSASIDLLKQSGETLAGRISYVELYPLSLLELTADSSESLSYEALWLRGGYPDSFLASSDWVSEQWRLDFIRTYLERDVSEFGPKVPSERLRRLWQMLAHLQGGLLNTANLARSLEVDNKTVGKYLDLLVDLLLVRRLRSWHVNIGKRLIKSPKIYLRDTGIMHSLLGISSFDTLLGHPKLGDSWESFVIENIASSVEPRVDLNFYRTAAGAEVDLVMNFGTETWLVEIKRTSVPKVSKGFYQACQDLSPQRQLVIHGGSDNFSLGKGFEAMSLQFFLEQLK